MEEKKQQENDEIVREPDIDKESCQQDEKACSEEKVETTENDKSAEERADSDDNENKINIREAIGKEVTWTAIAALGGAAIVIWNIIRYTFLWASSFVLYTETNVPIYLLEQRKNVGFTNFYLAYFTALILIMIISYTKYNFLSKEKSDRLYKWFRKTDKPAMIVFGLLIVICSIIKKSSLDRDLLNKIEYIANHIFLLFLGYVLPFYSSLYIVSLGCTCNELRELNKYGKLIEEIKEVYKSIKIAITVLICLIIVCFFYMCATNPYQLIDQYNRIIIADLGEHYIVQETLYDKNKKMLMADNSFYYVIDAADEKVSILRSFYKAKKQ